MAVKVLRPERDADPANVDALVAEAALCAQLRHPNIVQVDSVEREGERILVGMELVEGGSVLGLLRTLRARGLRMPGSAVLDIGIQVAHGLSYAWHGERDDGEPFRLVHRDLKPANLLLTPHGEVRIADFGLARRLGDPTQTASGTLKGTPCYVAPETLRGQRDFAPAVDLFALGCILSELCTGEILFGEEHLHAVLSRILLGVPAQDVAPIRARFPELAPLVEGLLQRDPARRVGDPREVERELRSLRARLPGNPNLARLIELVTPAEGGGRPGRPAPATTDPDWLALDRADTHRRAGEAKGRELPPTIALPAPGPGEVAPAASALETTEELRRVPPSTHPSRFEELPRSRGRRAARRRPRRRASALGLALAAAAVLAVALFVGLAAIGGRGRSTALPQSPPPNASPNPARVPEPEVQRAGPALPSTPEVERAVPPGSKPERSHATGEGGRPRGEELATGAGGAPVDEGHPSGGAVDRDPPSEGLAPRTGGSEVEPAAPEPAAGQQLTAGRGCLALSSDGPGRRLWIDGQPVGTVGSSRVMRERNPGLVRVGMGLMSEADASTTFILRAGRTAEVRCRLRGGAPSCSVEQRSGLDCTH